MSLFSTRPACSGGFVTAALLGFIGFACGSGPRSRAAAPASTAATSPGAPQPATLTTASNLGLRICNESPVHLRGAPGAKQSRGCVVTYAQELTDPVIIRRLETDRVQRRYLVYAPAQLTRPRTSRRPSPVVLVFPGRGTSAEGIAFYDTHTRFETLADRDGFIVVYGNGLQRFEGDEKPAMPQGGVLQGCFLEHSQEGIDVTYVRQIVSQLETELVIDRSRIFATGQSSGGGMAFQLALEAPDLVAAIAPVVSIPFQPSGEWLHHCHPKVGHERISIAMLAATHDPSVPYVAGGSQLYPQARYPGMQETRDAWLAAMHIHGSPAVEVFPDLVRGDSYEPHSQLQSSTVEIQRYPLGPEGQEFWFYKVEGAGHRWPNPVQTWSGLWEKFGKTNQDIDFADHAWEFFKRHAKSP